MLFAKLFVRGFTLARLFQIVGVFAALMMTGKRTLFLIPVMGLIVFALFFSKKHKISMLPWSILCTRCVINNS